MAKQQWLLCCRSQTSNSSCLALCLKYALDLFVEWHCIWIHRFANGNRHFIFKTKRVISWIMLTTSNAVLFYRSISKENLSSFTSLLFLHWFSYKSPSEYRPSCNYLRTKMKSLFFSPFEFVNGGTVVKAKTKKYMRTNWILFYWNFSNYLRTCDFWKLRLKNV